MRDFLYIAQSRNDFQIFMQSLNLGHFEGPEEHKYFVYDPSKVIVREYDSIKKNSSFHANVRYLGEPDDELAQLLIEIFNEWGVTWINPESIDTVEHTFPLGTNYYIPGEEPVVIQPPAKILPPEIVTPSAIVGEPELEPEKKETVNV